MICDKREASNDHAVGCRESIAVTTHTWCEQLDRGTALGEAARKPIHVPLERAEVREVTRCDQRDLHPASRREVIRGRTERDEVTLACSRAMVRSTRVPSRIAFRLLC